MDYMNYFSLISSLSKDDLKDLAKQMKVCCSGNKTEICGRIMKIVAKFDDSQGPTNQTGGYDYPIDSQELIGGFDYSNGIYKKTYRNFEFTPTTGPKKSKSYKNPQRGGKYKMVSTGRTVCSPLGCFEEFDAISTDPSANNKEKPMFL